MKQDLYVSCCVETTKKATDVLLFGSRCPISSNSKQFLKEKEAQIKFEIKKTKHII